MPELKLLVMDMSNNIPSALALLAHMFGSNGNSHYNRTGRVDGGSIP
jgi:hypothetical protein